MSLEGVNSYFYRTGLKSVYLMHLLDLESSVPMVPLASQVQVTVASINLNLKLRSDGRMEECQYSIDKQL